MECKLATLSETSFAYVGTVYHKADSMRRGERLPHFLVKLDANADEVRVEHVDCACAGDRCAGINRAAEAACAAMAACAAGAGGSIAVAAASSLSGIAGVAAVIAVAALRAGCRVEGSRSGCISILCEAAVIVLVSVKRRAVEAAIDANASRVAVSLVDCACVGSSVAGLYEAACTAVAAVAAGPCVAGVSVAVVAIHYRVAGVAAVIAVAALRAAGKVKAGVSGCVGVARDRTRVVVADIDRAAVNRGESRGRDSKHCYCGSTCKNLFYHICIFIFNYWFVIRYRASVRQARERASTDVWTVVQSTAQAPE